MRPQAIEMCELKKEINLDIKTYTEKSSRTCANLPSKQLDNLHMTMGMVTEVGELIDVFKKDLAYDKPFDWVNVKEEVGDLMWYVANFCRINNLDLEEILQINIDKLTTRYPEKFDVHKANNRDLDAERKILEQNSGC
jgi:NTP pyrophosphatase (non-canonical NTP hydrolase)